MRPVIPAFEAHQRLVSIHSFNDGNGRTSRLLLNYVQRYYDQPLTIVFWEDRQAYFEALEQSRVLEDLAAFHEFIRGQHGKSLTYQSATTQRISLVSAVFSALLSHGSIDS